MDRAKGGTGELADLRFGSHANPLTAGLLWQGAAAGSKGQAHIKQTKRPAVEWNIHTDHWALPLRAVCHPNPNPKPVPNRQNPPNPGSDRGGGESTNPPNPNP